MPTPITLPPGCVWADPDAAMAVALAQMEACAETLHRLAAIDRGDLSDIEPVSPSECAV